MLRAGDAAVIILLATDDCTLMVKVLGTPDSFPREMLEATQEAILQACEAEKFNVTRPKTGE